MITGDKIRRLRVLRNLSVEDVANKLNMSASNLRKIETGGIKTIDVQLVPKIAEAFGMDPQEMDNLFESYIFNNQHQKGGSTININHQDEKALDKVVKSMEETIQVLKEDIQFLRGMLQSLQQKMMDVNIKEEE